MLTPIWRENQHHIGLYVFMTQLTITDTLMFEVANVHHSSNAQQSLKPAAWPQKQGIHAWYQLRKTF